MHIHVGRLHIILHNDFFPVKPYSKENTRVTGSTCFRRPLPIAEVRLLGWADSFSLGCGGEATLIEAPFLWV